VFNLCIQEELLAYNPVLVVKKPRIRLVRPNYVPSHDELLKILDKLWEGARRFFLVLCNTGCRLGELQGANVSDVDFESEFLRVVRKGGKEDFVPMNAVVKQCIREEFQEREEFQPGDALFLNKRGQRHKRMTRSLGTACKKAGVPHCTHHSLRHSYATILHERGLDTGTIAKLLGHANPTITQNIYLHWKDEDVKRVAQSVEIGKVQKNGEITDFESYRRKRESRKSLKPQVPGVGIEPTTRGFSVRSLDLTKSYQMVKNKAF